MIHCVAKSMIKNYMHIMMYTIKIIHVEITIQKWYDLINMVSQSLLILHLQEKDN